LSNRIKQVFNFFLVQNMDPIFWWVKAYIYEKKQAIN
jgi:hypothetical protein